MVRNIARAVAGTVAGVAAGITSGRWVLHPVLFGLYAVLALYAANLRELEAWEVVRPSLLVVPVALLVIAVNYLVIRDWHRAGVAALLQLVLLLSFGHLLALAERAIFPRLALSIYDGTRYLTVVAALVLLLGTWAIWRVWRGNPHAATGYLNLLMGIALLFPLFTIAQDALRGAPEYQPTSPRALPAVEASVKPDIFYIILDAYARSDTLAELYGLDNSDFTTSLEQQGFYVADESRSNYLQTILSVTSSLNMEYMTDVAAELQGSQDKGPLDEMRRNSYVQRFLEAQGYQSVALNNGWMDVYPDDVDLLLTADGTGLNKFEGLFLNNTWPGTLFKTSLLFELQRQRVLYAFDALREVAQMEGPQFMIAHIIAPHPPFVFGPNGERVNPSRDYTLVGGMETVLVPSKYIQAYHDQTLYTTTLLEAAIHDILALSETPPIIIVQGDHGPAAYFHYDYYDDPQRSCLKERITILNAYYLPGITDSPDHPLYEQITPVNSFRIIFDEYFGTDFGLLPDRYFYTIPARPYDQVELTPEQTLWCAGTLREVQ